jgi:hypothetical protein
LCSEDKDHHSKTRVSGTAKALSLATAASSLAPVLGLGEVDAANSDLSSAISNLRYLDPGSSA